MSNFVHARYPDGNTKYDPNDGRNYSIPLGANLVLSAANQEYYNGVTIECTAALSITFTAGLIKDFAVTIIPPAAGNVSLVSDGTTLLNGATTTLTRAAAQNVIFAVIQRNSNNNSYIVNGS